ncbi:MAG: hypothetical protein ACSLEN_03435 [Candidatus Malihini olakiniferum]
MLRGELESLYEHILDSPLGSATPFKHTDERFSWYQKETFLASIISVGTLTADFKKSISVENLKPFEKTKIYESKENEKLFSISAKNVLLNASMVNISEGVKYDGDITVIAEGEITLDNATLKEKI